MSELTITEKLRCAGHTMGVSIEQLMNEMVVLYRRSDIEGLKELFSAYKDWELRENPHSKKPIEVIRIAKNNFDLVAMIADEYVKTGNSELAAVQAVESDGTGSITTFYRKIIDYQPPKPLHPELN